MQVTLDVLTQTVTFTTGGTPRALPFAQFGELLLSGSPGQGSVLTWVPVTADRRVGVTTSGMLRIQARFDPVTVELPVIDCAAYRMFDGNLKGERAWKRLVNESVIKPTGRRSVLITGIVPERTWEVEMAPDGVVKDTILWHGNTSVQAAQPWRLGNVNTEGHICWGDKPPTWSPATTIEEIDFFFLTGAAFNSDWQPDGFNWCYPEKWKVEEGKVVFGRSGTMEEWTFTAKAEVAGGQTQAVAQATVEGPANGTAARR